MNVKLENETIKTLFDCIENVTTLATIQFRNFSDKRLTAFGLKLIREFRHIADEIEKEIHENYVTPIDDNVRLQDDGCPHQPE